MCKFFFFQMLKKSDKFVVGRLQKALARSGYGGVRISSETENIAHSLGHTDSAYGSHGVHDDIERLFCVEQAVVDTETESHECDTRAEPQDTAFEKTAVLFPGNTVRGCGGHFNRGVQCDWLVVLVVVLQVHGIQF